MHSTIYTFLACILLPNVGWTGEKDDGARLAKQVAPFVDDMTTLVVHVDAKRFDIASVFQFIEGLGIQDKDLDAAKGWMTKTQALFRELGGRDAFVLLNWDAARLDEDFLIVIPLRGKTEARPFLALLAFVPQLKAKFQDETLLITTERNFQRIKDRKPRERPGLALGLAAFADDAVKVIVLPPPIVVRTFVEMFPRLPEFLGGGHTRDLGQGLQWAGLGISDKFEVTFRLQASDGKTAERFQTLSKAALEIPLHDPNFQLDFPQFVKLRPLLMPVVKGNQLVLKLDREIMTEIVGVAAKEARANAARARSINNLKQIGIAFHVYHDRHKSFPGAFSRDAKGRALLSWRVHLLPYLDHEAVYKQFKLNEPWDSPHNKKLAEIVVSVYQSPLNPGLTLGKTTYLVPTGAKTIFEGPDGGQFKMITDGTSNTVLVLEANSGKAVFWTQPEDFPIDQKDLLAGLVHPTSKGFLALYADGSVRWMSGRLNPMSLRGMLTASGGEVVDADMLDEPKAPGKK